MLRRILDILYPPRCPVCTVILPAGQLICEECEKQIVYVKEPFCKSCGKPLESEREEYCYDCRRRQHTYEAGVALVVYQGAVKKSLYAFKYQNKREYVRFYAKRTAERYAEWIRRHQIEAIVPIPLHKKRKRKRGYNQAELYADELGRLMGIPVVKNGLVRTKNTRPQKELNDVQRKNNLKKAFKCNPDIVQFRYVLLVDDIYTTGSTIDAAAAELKRSGVRCVYFVCISIGRGL